MSKLFYAYPGRDKNMRTSGFLALANGSDGIHPATEPASITLTDDSGTVIMEMPNIHFQDAGNGMFSASNEHGMVSIGPFASTQFFRITLENQALPAGFFRVRVHLCMNIGDDGFNKDLVCQKKPFGGFLCHQ